MIFRKWKTKSAKVAASLFETNENKRPLDSASPRFTQFETKPSDGNVDAIGSAERLKATMLAQLSGDDVIVVANREPYIHERPEDGGTRVLHPASGLVTALEPIMQACSGVWIGHGSGSSDREFSDRRGRVRVPPGEGSYLLRRVWLSREEEQGYYYGFSNEGLWPLCHLAHTRPSFDTRDFAQYRRVNRKFADAVCEEATSEDPIVRGRFTAGRIFIEAARLRKHDRLAGSLERRRDLRTGASA